MVSICHVILEDQVTQKPYDSHVRRPPGKSLLCQIWWPRRCGSGNIMALACHVISQDYGIKHSYDFMAKNPSTKVTILPNFVATETMVIEIWF